MRTAETATCPKCNHPVELPHKFMQRAWRKLTCPACQTRLELVPRRALLMLAPLNTLPLLLRPIERLVPPRQAMFWMGMAAGAYVMGAFALAIWWRWELRHPLLRIRRVPRPEITLNLGLKSPENIRTLR
jgi:hypothetical protein